ncbi:hypothetical protein EMIHUDRAFT_220074 [Emiliania huxleyi CCMP1516]|uniref:Uncharacterized protein n=2 Tax=Emiliania huxleyi TaxID=2903 RepID=A0A0D3I2Z1_EMIH1|nr:hypothetical protein EMIHUDRAFT_220074 [Emiliania huxleyi CCMP1516]EOD05626.1 hypothetical protein EMIHUDRAFT_220074 [Emiliania huxleyi CCMP1516]|eukprot:XP_005758055.1 hypothetical protein EMIHUDRAFT_220074 [Emiliania huxleyi CCMP1516]
MLIDKDLGEMPPADRPSERALWVAALLNPGLSVAKTGMVDSMYKLKGGSWPMNTYYW